MLEKNLIALASLNLLSPEELGVLILKNNSNFVFSKKKQKQYNILKFEFKDEESVFKKTKLLLKQKKQPIIHEIIDKNIRIYCPNTVNNHEEVYIKTNNSFVVVQERLVNYITASIILFYNINKEAIDKNYKNYNFGLARFMYSLLPDYFDQGQFYPTSFDYITRPIAVRVLEKLPQHIINDFKREDIVIRNNSKFTIPEEYGFSGFPLDKNFFGSSTIEKEQQEVFKLLLENVDCRAYPFTLSQSPFWKPEEVYPIEIEEFKKLLIKKDEERSLSPEEIVNFYFDDIAFTEDSHKIMIDTVAVLIESVPEKEIVRIIHTISNMIDFVNLSKKSSQWVIKTVISIYKQND